MPTIHWSVPESRLARLGCRPRVLRGQAIRNGNFGFQCISISRAGYLQLCRLFIYAALYTAPFSQPSNIFFKTPMSVPFSNAAATLSLSASCRLTCSAVLCVPSLILTSTRNLGGRACSSLTRTPKPITVAREQCVIVGVMRTVSVVSGDDGPLSGNVGLRKMSGRLTTESEPRVNGCSGSEMLEMRSVEAQSASHA